MTATPALYPALFSSPRFTPVQAQIPRFSADGQTHPLRRAFSPPPDCRVRRRFCETVATQPQHASAEGGLGYGCHPALSRGNTGRHRGNSGENRRRLPRWAAPPCGLMRDSVGLHPQIQAMEVHDLLGECVDGLSVFQGFQTYCGVEEAPQDAQDLGLRQFPGVGLVLIRCSVP